MRRSHWAEFSICPNDMVIITMIISLLCCRNMKWSSFYSSSGLTHASNTPTRVNMSFSMQSTTTTTSGCQTHTLLCMEISRIHSFLFTLLFASTAMAQSRILCGKNTSFNSSISTCHKLRTHHGLSSVFCILCHNFQLVQQYFFQL